MPLPDDEAGGETENRPPDGEAGESRRLRTAGEAKQRARLDQEEVDGQDGLHERKEARPESAVPGTERDRERQRRRRKPHGSPTTEDDSGPHAQPDGQHRLPVTP